MVQLTSTKSGASVETRRIASYGSQLNSQLAHSPPNLGHGEPGFDSGVHNLAEELQRAGLDEHEGVLARRLERPLREVVTVLDDLQLAAVHRGVGGTS